MKDNGVNKSNGGGGECQGSEEESEMQRELPTAVLVEKVFDTEGKAHWLSEFMNPPPVSSEPPSSRGTGRGNSGRLQGSRKFFCVPSRSDRSRVGKWKDSRSATKSCPRLQIASGSSSSLLERGGGGARRKHDATKDQVVPPKKSRWSKWLSRSVPRDLGQQQQKTQPPSPKKKQPPPDAASAEMYDVSDSTAAVTESSEVSDCAPTAATVADADAGRSSNLAKQNEQQQQQEEGGSSDPLLNPERYRGCDRTYGCYMRPKNPASFESLIESKVVSEVQASQERNLFRRVLEISVREQSIVLDNNNNSSQQPVLRQLYRRGDQFSGGKSSCVVGAMAEDNTGDEDTAVLEQEREMLELAIEKSLACCPALPSTGGRGNVATLSYIDDDVTMATIEQEKEMLALGIERSIEGAAEFELL